MALTYEKIATTTLSSATADVTFSSISGAYTDLVLAASATSDALAAVYIYYNTTTGTTNYSHIVLSGNGSAASNFRSSDQPSNLCSVVDTVISNFNINILNYSNTTTNKNMLSRGGGKSWAIRAFAGIWRSTAAITSITLNNGGGNFTSGSTFTLYGIKAA